MSESRRKLSEFLFLILFKVFHVNIFILSLIIFVCLFIVSRLAQEFSLMYEDVAGEGL
jgi:hypothetical protein